ncbi:MAG: hypothetical protein A2932_00730 [Candidatus Spechtbacteria bacterium RIFCSPLOWO2_01_FULL_46_10]|uniref:30S ribosomal protein S21 n=1 Tax=Candidatus Spechtbacteria bacterium RIFCSPLOWO2_01_FULL_46_10 TaxID=1802163 RepID=A0A1G2HHQ2_9BACT|nr:MAG: hypothetical protein A2932_00730 [Candidatus Spechtbacteria bacterium RIFCSPLOWO2_01_FULL_46_10]
MTKPKAGMEVKRAERENTGSLLRRFNQKIRSSGVLFEARRNQFRNSIPNRNARRRSALVRVKDRERYRELRKWGKKRNDER